MAGRGGLGVAVVHFGDKSGRSAVGVLGGNRGQLERRVASGHVGGVWEAGLVLDVRVLGEVVVVVQLVPL